MLYIYGKSAVPQGHSIKRLNVTERSFSLPTTFWKTVLQLDQKSLKFYHQTSPPSVTFTLTCSISKFYKCCAFIFRSFGAYRFILLCSIFSSSDFINKVRTYARVLMIRWLIETRDKDKTWIFLQAFTVRTLFSDWTILPKREKVRKHVLLALREV